MENGRYKILPEGVKFKFTHTHKLCGQTIPSESWVRGQTDILGVIFGSREPSKHCKLIFTLSRTAGTDLQYCFFWFTNLQNLCILWKYGYICWHDVGDTSLYETERSTTAPGKTVSLEQMANDSFYGYCNYFPFHSEY